MSKATKNAKKRRQMCDVKLQKCIGLDPNIVKVLFFRRKRIDMFCLATPNFRIVVSFAKYFRTQRGGIGLKF